MFARKVVSQTRRCVKPGFRYLGSGWGFKAGNLRHFGSSSLVRNATSWPAELQHAPGSFSQESASDNILASVDSEVDETLA